MVSYGHPSTGNPFDRMDSGGWGWPPLNMRPWMAPFWGRWHIQCRAYPIPLFEAPRLLCCLVNLPNKSWNGRPAAVLLLNFQTHFYPLDVEIYNFSSDDGYLTVQAMSNANPGSKRCSCRCFSNFALVFGARQLVNSLKVCGEVQKWNRQKILQAWEPRLATLHMLHGIPGHCENRNNQPGPGSHGKTKIIAC